MINNISKIFKICGQHGLYIAVLVTFILHLSGCNVCHLPIRGCGSDKTDWYEIGYSDGTRGVQKRLTPPPPCDPCDPCDPYYSCAPCGPCTEVKTCGRPRSCNGYCFQPINNEYYDGWRAGVRQFCQPCVGFSIGCQGRPYPCICPPDLAGPFRAAWYQGIKRYYTPEYTCGRGYCNTYCTPPLECKYLGEVLPVPNGCPCNVVN